MIGTYCKLLFTKRALQNLRRLHVSNNVKGYEAPHKTTVSIINNMDENVLLIQRCNERGFLLNNKVHMLGPMVLFPKTLLYWDVDNGASINEASLSLFGVLEPKLDLVVVGLEQAYSYSRIREIKDMILKLDIPSEVLPVPQAVAAYNFLCAEGRFVAAAMIPPKHKMQRVNKPTLVNAGTEITV